jgi:N-acetyl-gamma-glutamyl-phosphate reductase
MIKAGVIGGAGYAGSEVVRLLLAHPGVELCFVQSRSQEGKSVASVHRDLTGETDLVFTNEISTETDVWILCLGHGEAQQWLAKQAYQPHIKIIDLSHDFRAGGAWGGAPFVYGLPELFRAPIQTAQCVANPGCFATALQLALLPLAAAGQLNPVYATGITGATGAGQALSPTSHFPWRHANVSAYKTLEHQHISEIKRSLSTAGATDPMLHFVPWRGDFARGIFISCTTACTLDQDTVFQLFDDFYQSHLFTIVSREMIDLKMAVNTNKCFLFPEKVGDQLVVHATIDNLLKGAAGQAVQNLNLMCGLPETAGLQLKSTAF